jgi:hypothetical protein
LENITGILNGLRDCECNDLNPASERGLATGVYGVPRLRCAQEFPVLQPDQVMMDNDSSSANASNDYGDMPEEHINRIWGISQEKLQSLYKKG